MGDDSSDPYAMVYIGDESKSQQTKTIEENLNPSWSEWLIFEMIKMEDDLTVRLMDADLVGSDDPLGEVKIPIADAVSQFKAHGNSGQWFKLVGEGSGDGEVELGFEFQDR